MDPEAFANMLIDVRISVCPESECQVCYAQKTKGIPQLLILWAEQHAARMCERHIDSLSAFATSVGRPLTEIKRALQDGDVDVV